MNTSHVPNSSQNQIPAGPNKDILPYYIEQLQQLRMRLAVVQVQRFRVWIAALTCVLLLAAAVCLWLVSGHFWLTAATFPGLCLAPVSIAYRRLGDEWKHLASREESLESGIARLSDAWQSTGETGFEFARPGHLYQEDLQVLGEGSLFTLLCTTRSRIGAERLAAFLLDPVDSQESRLRQEGVKELRDAGTIRDELNLLGTYRLQDCAADDFTVWFDSPKLTVPSFLLLLLRINGALFLSLCVGIWVHVLPWQSWIPLLAGLLLVQTATIATLLPRARVQLQQLRLLTNSFTVLWQGLALMERLEFHSLKLKTMVEQLRGDHASRHVRALERLVRASEQREKPEFYLLACLFAAGTQLVVAVDSWRAAHQVQFKEWLHLWAEFEALQALATYAFEHPSYVFPELVENCPAPTLEVRQLCHPLLPANACVANDISLNQSSRFYLISGSNMAGKSTLLRAIGLNVVLAQAGGPVCASFAHISNLHICAAFSPRESLQEGRSRFLSEVERLRGALSAMQSGANILFLVDEVLSGTNSHDRKLATEIILRTLLAGGAIGALSTHDLALASLVEKAEQKGMLVHMGSSDPDHPLDFDYLLKSGISRVSSALAIVKMMGIDSVPYDVERP